MECFVHSGTAAVGICKACGRGVCKACSVDLPEGLACKSRHEDAVRDLDALRSRAHRGFAEARRAARMAAFGTAGIFIISVFIGWVVPETEARIAFGGLAALSGVISVVSFFRASRLR